MLNVWFAFLEQYNNFISVYITTYISWNHVIFHDACTDTTNYLIMPFSIFPFMYNMTTWDTAPNIIIHIQQGYRPRLYDIYLSKDIGSHSIALSLHHINYFTWCFTIFCINLSSEFLLNFTTIYFGTIVNAAKKYTRTYSIDS
jgi:hypothetical protein